MSASFRQTIENISSSLPPGSPEYERVCFLAARVIDKTVLSKGALISKIYYDGFDKLEGGRAYFWYILEKFRCTDYLGELGVHIAPGSLNTTNPSLQLGILLATIASAISREKEAATGLINIVGRGLKPPVLLSQLPHPDSESGYFNTLLKFFEKAEQRRVIKPDDVSKLSVWLSDCGQQSLVEDFVDKFDPREPIRLDGPSMMPRQCSQDNGTRCTPPCGEGSLRNKFEKSQSEESSIPPDEKSELIVRTSSFDIK